MDKSLEKNIQIYKQDANAFVPDFCSRLGPRDRAVLLLDPYSTQLEFQYVAEPVILRSNGRPLFLFFFATIGSRQLLCILPKIEPLDSLNPPLAG